MPWPAPRCCCCRTWSPPPAVLRHDRFVPFAHGQWLASRIPDVDARLSDDDGHLTLTINHLDEVHEWLLDRMR